MPIERIDKFLRVSDIGITPSLGIESDKIHECITEVNRCKLKGIFGSSAFGFTGSDLDFLSQMPQLTQIWFWEVALKNVTGIYTLKDLELFNVHNRKDGIDFSRLPNLRHVVLKYVPKDTGIPELTRLEQLDLWHFNPKSKSFGDVALPMYITRLDINWANPKTLNGLPHLPNLKELQLHYCKSLTSLAELDSIAPNLERLIVASCKNCEDTSAISNLPSLKHVFINKPARGS